MVRDKVGPVAAFKIAMIVKRLPKTRSGKILRGTVRKIADNEPYKMPATIDDQAILDQKKGEIKKLSKLGMRIKIYNEKEMKRLGLNALVGVGQGSINESFLVTIEWKGKRKSKQKPS